MSKYQHRPKVVCLCGSTKFKNEFEEANKNETFKGHVVLSVGCFTHADNIKITEEEKRKFDELHLRKIDLADEVFVINKNGYIGESTRREVDYAVEQGKLVRFLEPQRA